MSLRYVHPDVRTAPCYVTPRGRVLGVDEKRGPRAVHDPSRRWLVFEPQGAGARREFLLPAAQAEPLSWLVASLREPVYVLGEAVIA